MARISDLIDLADPRIETRGSDELPAERRCVLWWMSRAKRATGNLATNQAIAIADRLGLPVIALFCIVPTYPRATERAYRFMIEGLADLPEELQRRGIGWIVRVGEPGRIVPEIAQTCRAAVVVTDLDPLRPGREWRDAVAGRLSTPLVVVDTDTIVPSALFPKEEWAPRTMRPKIARMLPDVLPPIADPPARHRSNVLDVPDLEGLLGTFPLDRAVGPSGRFRGGTHEARLRLARFVEERLPTYAVDRNRADLDGTSELSPYLHFGQIGPLEVALAAQQAAAPTEDRDAFLNELIVQRELCINFALRNAHYDAYDGLPDWGRRTLAAHADDPRPALIDPADLEAGASPDPLWNAAQRQLVGEGWMPNRLRMYWAKQLLLWTPTPQDAFALAVHLNDRYFVDGRDANGYAGIAWSIGGRHDRPFPPERPILGLIRPMSARGMRKHVDVDGYIRQITERFGR